MARQIIVNSENKSIDVIVQARSNIAVTVSRAVITSGVITQVNAGNNIQVSTVGTTATVSTSDNIVISGNVTANAFYGNLVGNVVGNIVVPGTQWDILYNNNGNAGASDKLRFDANANILTIVGNVIANRLQTTPTGNALIYNTSLAGNTSVLGSLDVLNANLTTGNINMLNAIVNGNLTLTTNGPAGVANVYRLKVRGNVDSNLVPNVNLGYNLGNITYRWNKLYVNDQISFGNNLSISADNSRFSMTSKLWVDGSDIYNITAANITGQVGNSLVAGTVYTNAQPNITSVGTLTNVSVTGNASIGNVKTNNLLYANGDPYQFTTNAAGSNTYVQFNDGNSFGGNSQFTYDKVTDTLSVGNITASANITGTLKLPNGGIITEGFIPNGPTGNTIIIEPSSGQHPDQKLLVYPTSFDADHLHLTSGNLRTTELYFGDDNLYVKLANTGNVIINSNNYAGNSAQWTFGSDSNLSLPDGAILGDIYNDGGTGLQAHPNAGSYTIIASNDLKQYIQTDNSGIFIGTDYPDNNYNWEFQKTGNTLFPANGNVSLGNLATANKFYAGVGGDEYHGYGFTGASNSNTAMCLSDTDEITIYNNANETVTFYANNDTKIYGNLITNSILPSSNVTHDIGSSTQRYKDLYLSNSTIYLGAVQISATADALSLPNANITTDLVVGGNATIAGNLTVSGTTEYTNVNNLYIKDPLIEIGGAANNQPLSSNDGKDRGELLHYYTTQPVDAFMGWKSGNSEFQFGSNVSTSDNVVTINTYGNIRAQHIYANINGANVVGDTSGANHANIADVANSVAGANVSGTVANATYAVTAGSTAQSNYANIANSVAGANVSGAVAYATTANSVAGANVSGSVSQSNYANIANSVAGANVSGQVAFAAVANSVAGANVTGSVSQSNYANIANSVSVSNVSGIGNIATINLNGSTTQVLYGNGVFATLTIPSGTGISNGTSNVNIPVASGNVNTSVGATPNVLVVTTTGVNVSGYLNSTGNITGANASLGNLVTSNYFSGNGSLLTSLTGANVSGTVSSATTATTAGTVTTAAQPNITSVGTLSSLTVSGSITTTNIVGPTGGGANIDIGPDGVGHVNINADTLRIGDTNVDAQIWTRGTGNLTIKTHDIEVNESNITIINGATGNIQLNPKGIVVTTSNVQANYFIGNGSSLTSITGANVTGTVASATLATTATTANAVAGANVSGTVSSATTAGTVTTAAQSNITSLGTLTGLTSGGVVNFTTSSNVTLGAVGNVRITGGTNGYVLSTNGTGGLSWVAQSGGGGGTPGGNTTELQFNNAGSFGGIAGVTYATGNLTLGAVANVKITGGSSNLFMRTDGAGNLSFQAITSNLTVGTRSTAVNIGITNYTMNVAARTGNVTVNVN